MAIDLYEPFTNPITRETFRCLASDESAYRMEWTVHPGGYVPFEHIHGSQDEIFHIKHGVMRARIDGVERIGKSGETVHVPRGIRHIAYNDQPDPLVCHVEYQPGLDQFQAMQCFAGLTLDGFVGRNGLVDIPRIMYLLRRAGIRSWPRPAILPEWVFKVGLQFFYIIGWVMGWERLYGKYTG